MVRLKVLIQFCFVTVVFMVRGASLPTTNEKLARYQSVDINATTITSVVSHRRKCKALRNRYQVKPGVSWGDMGPELQQQWMDLRCDQFFCEPDPKEGRGVYKCIPLRRNDTAGT
jgi:hypothetical protein